MKRKKSRWFLIPGVVALSFIGCCAVPVAKVKWSSAQVQGFCDSLEKGAPVEGLQKRAEEMWLRVEDYPAREDSRAKLLVFEGWAFSRIFCEVEHEGGFVVGKDLITMD